ncbi:hypothetical protein [Bacillus sp. TL12]|uniref:hypothetical protein n=1 Tax=Bacillus sp. TL12 TaxID=2894756 RepID=UPI001F517796|nr:hypothetical protein [Bacillus sp. TL12]MCI0768118.1 hypothetical protein [Bacillus sp. TL12]
MNKEIPREIEYEDVIDYWEKFFLELKNKLSINEFLQNISRKNSEHWKENEENH